MHHVLDITKSLAYHGFKKIILLNGHGSNMPNLDLVARRTNLETDAECVLAAWWNLLTVDKDVPAAAGGRASSPAAARTPASWRRRCTSTSTATTSARTRSRAATISFNEEDSPFNWVDLFAAGPGDGHLVDEQLLRNRRPGRRRAGHAPRRAGRPTRRRSSSSCGSSPGSRTGPKDVRTRPPPQAADHADPVGAAALRRARRGSGSSVAAASGCHARPIVVSDGSGSTVSGSCGRELGHTAGSKTRNQ